MSYNYGNSRYNNRNQYNNPYKKGSSSGSKNPDKSKVHFLPVSEGPHSPYNFVPISRRVFKDPRDEDYSVISDETYTGEIRYCLTAKTPIFIDNGRGGKGEDPALKDFFRNKDGKYAIPAGTLRGLIRENVQILGFSEIKDDIDDYSLMYRAVAGGYMQKTYNDVLGQKEENKISILKNVKAGYIERKGNDYNIYPNEGDGNGSFQANHPDYYIVSERTVIEEKGVRKKDFQYLLNRFQNLDKPFQKTEDKRGRTHYKGTANPKYVPYSLPISYRVSNGKVCGIAEKDVLPHNGYVISSGIMNEKKAFYVIPKIDHNPQKALAVSQESVTSYNVDLNNKRNILKGSQTFYELPKDGEIRPIFYIPYEGRLYFGYTPRLRLMYKNTISKGIGQDSVRTLDFAKNMFGFSNEKDAAKSKVFFTDAILEGEGKKTDERKFILAGPKPTSYLEYLMQTNGQEVSTYDDKMRLRGTKHYWLQENAQKKQPEGIGNDNDKVKSRLEPLDAGSRFSGTVRFQNLSKEELGLLLWSIKLNEGSQMNIGMGKPYGYGRIKVDNIELYLAQPEKNYVASSDIFSKDPLDKKSEEDIDGFVSSYKEYATNELGHDVMAEPSIEDFFTMKSKILKGRDISYMTLDEFKNFKQKNNPLPTVEMITKNSGK